MYHIIVARPPIMTVIVFSFDISQKRLDMVNVIRKAAERGVIHQIKDIKKGFVIEKDGSYILQVGFRV